MIIRLDRKCLVCGEYATIEVTEEQAERVRAWASGQDSRFIQDALPFLNKAEREILLSGTHGECFERMFPPEEDD